MLAEIHRALSSALIARLQRGRHHVPLQGLSPERPRPPAGGARRWRVHPTLPATRPAQGLSPHPPLRPARQRQPRTAPAGCARSRRLSSMTWRSSRQMSDRRARAAAARWSSSRSSNAAISRVPRRPSQAQPRDQRRHPRLVTDKRGDAVAGKLQGSRASTKEVP